MLFRSTHTYGETPASYVVGTTNNNATNYFVNELTWDAVPGALFYHIYRKSTLVGDQTESRLTDVATITGSGAHTTTTDTMATTELLGNTYDAFKFTVGGTTTITSVELEIKSAVALTGYGTDYLTVNLVADASGEPGAFLKQGENILFSDITTGYTVFTQSLSYTLSAGTYWIVIGRSATPSSNLYLHRGAYSSGIIPGEVSGSTIRVTPKIGRAHV